MSWLKKLSEGLRKTSANITSVFTLRKLDADALEQLEETLIIADMGPATAASIVAEIVAGRVDKDIGEDELRTLLAAAVAKRLKIVEISTGDAAGHALPPAGRDREEGVGLSSALSEAPSPNPLPQGERAFTPRIVLVVGVNGNGKTTTIGKLAHGLTREGKKVMLVAADTFRAAAVEQLQVWARRAGCQFVRGETNADPASVAYKGVEEALKTQADLVFIDTAGRLHTKDNLRAELEKITKVIRKLVPDAPHEVLQVLDATTAQNAVAQVKAFREVVGVTGLVVTKLDGTAKAGIIVALADQFKLPIHAIGVGEGAEDLQPFNAEEFAKALVGAV